MSVELKIKSKHLSYEPKIIRKEEYKLLEQIKWLREKHQISPNTPGYKLDESIYKFYRKWYSLYLHRIFDVRNESRATFLARAYISGKPYEAVEKSRKEEKLFVDKIIPRVLSMVTKYGNDKIEEDWDKNKNKYVYLNSELEKSIKKWANVEN